MKKKSEEIPLNPVAMILRKLDEMHLDIKALKHERLHMDLQERILNYINTYWDTHKSELSFSIISRTFGKQTKKLGGISLILEQLKNEGHIDIFTNSRGGHTCAPIGHKDEILTPLSKKEIELKLPASIEEELAEIRRKYENENTNS